MTDLLIVNSIGPGFTLSSCRAGIGGSELEMAQVAHALARRGMKVTVANGVTEAVEEEGVRYIPFAQAEGMKVRSLWIERMTHPPSLEAKRIVVRATDVYCPPYDVHKALLESGHASLIINTNWQASLFPAWVKDRVIIPPSLDYSVGGELPKKTAGLYVFASMPMKGLAPTREAWRSLCREHPDVMSSRRLLFVLPGQYDFGGDRALALSNEDLRDFGMAYAEKPTLEEYRRHIASAEGLFYVNEMPETFCCAAAFADAFGTRPHILCLNGFGGIGEAVVVGRQFVTVNRANFERDFLQPPSMPVVDRRDYSPDALATLWEKALTPPPLEVRSPEARLTQEDMPANRTPFSQAFGQHLSLMKEAIAVGGSEMGLGLMLQSLVASVRARTVVEVGRYKGFSTLALASGLKLIDEGWQEPRFARQRQDVDYARLLDPKAKRKLTSIDPHPMPEAEDLLVRAGLRDYVTLCNAKSDDVDPATLGNIDVLLLDGEHTIGAMRKDIERYVPHVRPGGYFLLHDYFGWFNERGENGSPIKRAIDERLEGFERVLIDTGFASFVLFRKNQELVMPAVRVPARADGRPTVGLVLIAVGAEAATVAARAIVSAWKMVDRVTVVVDPAEGGEQTAEVCRHIGADVYLRPSPKIDWERGIGTIAGARNEALAIAEPKTDYVLALDADDTLEGELPKNLDRDFYEMPIRDGGVEYRRMQLWRSDKGFRYEGIVHETLNVHGTFGRLSSVTYQRRFGGGRQDSVPREVKYGRHARLLEIWVAMRPDDARGQFYLAQSYKDGGQPEKAIAAYEKRIAMGGGFLEEIAFSAWQIGRIKAEMGQDPTVDFLRAHELRPTRAEPLVDLAKWLREGGRKRFALAVMVAKRASEIPRPADDGLFIEPSVYQYRALEEYAVSSYWNGDKATAFRVYEDLLGKVPDGYRPHIAMMHAMCKTELSR